MSDGGRVGEKSKQSVGIVAPESDAEQIAEAATDAGGVPRVGPATEVTNADVVVAVGADALGDLASAGVAAPVLPVAVEDVAAVPPKKCESALEGVFGGKYATREHPLVCAATPDGVEDRALFDVSLQTVAPASISEFSIDVPSNRLPTEDGDIERIARFRADGVVAATPAGSRGYARAAGGPAVVPGSEVVSVAPVAPFATDPDRWIVPLSAFTLTVERDEVDVELSVDGRPLDTVTAGSTIELLRDGELHTVLVAESQPAGSRE